MDLHAKQQAQWVKQLMLAATIINEATAVIKMPITIIIIINLLFALTPKCASLLTTEPCRRLRRQS
jgi:hypothetical protein